MNSQNGGNSLSNVASNHGRRLPTLDLMEETKQVINLLIKKNPTSTGNNTNYNDPDDDD